MRTSFSHPTVFDRYPAFTKTNRIRFGLEIGNIGLNIFPVNQIALSLGATQRSVPWRLRRREEGASSNWRGPIWFPLNYLIIEALERYHYFYGNDFKVECPKNSGQLMNLAQIAQELSARLYRIFLPDSAGHCPWRGDESRYASDPSGVTSRWH